MVSLARTAAQRREQQDGATSASRFRTVAVADATPAPVIELVAHAFAVAHATPAPAIELVAPAPAVAHATPAPVIELVAQAPSPMRHQLQ